MTDPDLVVITGTSSGLGRAMTIGLAQAGYRVVGISRRDVSAASLALEPGQYTHICFDLADVGGIPELAAGLVAANGAPYALVNNAALGSDGILPTMHNSEIERLIQVNITAPIVLTKYLSRPMLVARRGRVVNVSSIVARTGYRGLSVYAASKAAMEGFTRSLARELGPRNVTVNCIAPGFTETEMTSSLGAVNLERIKKRSALGRFPTPAEVAGGVEYLLSSAGGAVTGTTITIDAGNTA
ncbi:SDR family NAD(P)-dependent oxidoreductase [Pengzhenrongella sicca]|uniref:SDR family oxidoreductase n=1 Tax=Pengzhenrongella sicca TaxID=2819238 RepID=A0A8A4ZH61_9MICO|nr:SDR family NAD(P)-dependent oxidoreductase [Pengzhenrongella sicca]QTE29866.1 SDR family oxidoreductase [Pengzhenrongella sicca]